MRTVANFRKIRRWSVSTAAVAALALCSTVSGPAAVAAEGDVRVVNTETVQVYVDSQGDVDSRRVYEQLTVTGNGSVDIANPIEERGLRNLDGFSGYDVADGIQRMSLDVDGVERLRSVSDYTGDLPLDVSVEYRLDGALVDPDDIVGAEGALEVLYTVRNVTAQEQEVTYSDGQGGTITETVEVPIPMVGSLTTNAPASFTELESGQANMAGDGKGGTKLSFTMTLFPPLGSDQVSFGYTAKITDGVVPGSTVTALPVNPLDSPTFKTAGESYKAGSRTGSKLAAGATEIDTNLLRLRDGAGDLLAGLIKLRDGADRLSAGLAGEAAPGARELATGAGRLDEGLGQIDDGASRLSDGTRRLRHGSVELDEGAGRLAEGSGRLGEGAGRLFVGAGALSSGTGQALTGSQSLEDGLEQISGGLAALADSSTGLPTAIAGVDALKAGVDRILAGFGSVDQDGTLLFGLHALEQGLASLEGGSTQLVDGLSQLRGSSTGPSGLVAARGGVDQVRSGLDAALAPGGDLDRLAGGLTQVKTLFCATHLDLAGQCSQTVDALLGGVVSSRQNLTQAAGGLGLVSGGLGAAIGALDTQILPGARAISAGLGSAKVGATRTKAGALALRDGASQLGDGLTLLRGGLVKAVSGIGQLSGGAAAAHDGSSALASGLGQIHGGAGQLVAGSGELSDGAARLASGSATLAAGTARLRAGAGELADGAGRLAAGTGDAAVGSGLLADGAGRLADGLGTAADGSGRLAEGLATAAAGAPKIVDGAGRLSDEGMSRLVEAGEATAQDYGKLYAVIEAGAERADTEWMAYGAPEDARGLTAYSYELMGNDGQGARNTVRGIAALLLLALGLGTIAVRRRLV